MEWKRKIYRSGGSLAVLLPKDLAEYLDVEESDSVTMTEDSFTKVVEDENTEATKEL